MKIDPKLPESEIDFSEYSEEEVHEYYLEQTDAYGDNIMEQPMDWDERPWEPLGEMADVVTLNNPVISIQVNPSQNRIGNPYFKVYDTLNLRKDTRVMRLHFLDTGMEYHRDAYKDWRPSSKDIKMVKKVLSMNYYMDNKNQIATNKTNWQMACWLWNRYYGFFNPFDQDDYFDGKYDEQFKDHPSYVPSTTQMPDTWIYDPNAAKKKRK